jgi:large subunit ribosomal protein L25
MSEIVLNAGPREVKGKRTKYVRDQGNVPGVFYAHGEESLSIQVPKLSLDPLIYTSEMHIIDLRLKDGATKKCILRDVQFDPVSDKPIHFDLQGLRENEKLTIDVPIILTGGVPKGVREGGMMQHIIHKLRVSCLPKDIPDKIEVEVANLEINQSIHVNELSVQNVTVLENPDNPVVSVVPPTVIKEPELAAAAEEEIAEPEVVGKGKKEDEEKEEEEGAESKPAGKKSAPKEETAKKPSPK